MSILSKEKVVRILGPDTVDDHTIVALIASGASEDDLTDAYNLLVSGDDLLADQQSAAKPKVADVYNLLAELDVAWEEEPGRDR